MDEIGEKEIYPVDELLVDVGARLAARGGTVAPGERVGALAPPAVAAQPADGGEARPHSSADPSRRVAPHTYGPRSLLWLLLVLVAATAALTVYLTGGRSAESDSLAILPFSIGGGDADTEVIADGIRETLTNTLSRLPRIRVIAASSMSRFKSGNADAERVGRELGVRTVVTGRVVQQGDTLAVNAELVRVADGTQLWGGSFIRPISDIFVVEGDLAAEIVRRLRPQLSSVDRDVLRTRYTGNVAAYQLYLKGRYHWNKRTVQGFSDAIACFKQAIAADPTYALAYARLADCYALLGAGGYGALPPSEMFPKARAAAARALEIDPGLAEAHASLGLVEWTFEWDRPAAERSLRRAIELAPAYATAHRWYAEMLAEAGRQREAEGEIRRARDLDPLSLVINADLGLFAYYARDYDQAVEHYKAALAMEPHFVPARLGLALTYAQERQFDGALNQLDQAARVAPGEPGVLAARGYVLGRAGRLAEARRAADELQRLSAQRYVPAYYIGGIFVGLGDTGAAFTWLDKSCEQRCSLLGAIAVDPAFDPLRGDPRFAAVLRCAGLGR